MLDKHFPLYIAIFFLSFLLTVLFEKIMIPSLTNHAKQPIYEEGPKWHMKKSGTPTMGGVGFLIAVSVSLLISSFFLFGKTDSKALLSLLICQFYAVLNALVGVIDDIKKLKKHKNKGLTPTEKLILQFAFAVLFLFLRKVFLNESTAISFSFGSVDLGFFYYPISVIILLGVINFANLTDGIDGLASSVAFSCGVSLFYIAAALNTEAASIAAAVIGASIGFLVFNLHPAKIFMGDTGSLYFGALISSSAFILNNPLIIVFVAGVYVLEGLSVILQVASYKITGKRIFKMAPVHHHLEQHGWSENRICIVAMLLTFIFSVPAYIFYLP